MSTTHVLLIVLFVLVITAPISGLAWFLTAPAYNPNPRAWRLRPFAVVTALLLAVVLFWALGGTLHVRNF